jgi:hypothetical protein
VTVASTVALSLVLFVTTHHLIPFNISLLCAAAVSELAACRGRLLRQRWMAPLVANFAILITVWFSRSGTLPDGYAALRPSTVLAIQLALVLVYLVSMGYRTLVAQTVANVFEIGQNVVAIGLFILGQVIMVAAGSQRLLVGVICAIIALGCYVASIVLAHKGAQVNSLVYAMFGMALLIAATAILFPPDTRVFTWCVLGAVAAWLGNREHQMSLQLQAPVYLSGGLLASGLIQISSQSLASLMVPRADHLIAMFITTAAVVLTYILSGSGHASNARIFPLFCAALLVWSVLGLAAIAIKMTCSALFVATSLRIGLICLAAVGSAHWGMLSRSRAYRPEWVWLSYPLMIYGAWRIIVEDLTSGRPGAPALSLLLYGGTLLLLTRILRPAAQA